MAKSDMLNKYIFTSYKCQIKIVLLFFLCDAMLNDISTAPTSEVITAAMLEPQTGGKRDRDLEQYDCPAKLSVCHSFLSSSQGNKSYTEHTQLLEKMPYWMEIQQAMHIRDIVVKSRVNWVLEYL
jgi:hypothetical protein